MDNRHRFYAPLFAEHPHFDTFYRRFSLSIFFFFSTGSRKKDFSFLLMMKGWGFAKIFILQYFDNRASTGKSIQSVCRKFVKNEEIKGSRKKDSSSLLRMKGWGFAKIFILQYFRGSTGKNIHSVCCTKSTNYGRSILRYVLSPVFFIYFFFFNRIEKGWSSLSFWRWKAEVLQRYLFCNSLNTFESRLVKIFTLFVENL